MSSTELSIGWRGTINGKVIEVVKGSSCDDCIFFQSKICPSDLCKVDTIFVTVNESKFHVRRL